MITKERYLNQNATGKTLFEFIELMIPTKRLYECAVARFTTQIHLLNRFKTR